MAGMLQQRDASCDKGHVYKQSMIHEGRSAIWLPRICPVCQDARDARDKAQQVDDERVAKMRRAMLELDVPPLYCTAVVDESGPQGAAHRAMAGYLKAFPDVPPIVVFGGSFGTGKTYLAYAVAQTVCRAGRTARMVKLTAMVRQLRGAWAPKAEANEDAVLKTYRRPDLLVIDEVSKHVLFQNQQVQQHLYDVVDDRVNHMRPTILTSNEDTAGLKALLGDALFDRLHRGQLLMFTGASLRRQKDS